MENQAYTMYIIVSVCTLLTAVTNLPRVTSEHAKVLILGAGVSGIQAAGTLSANGFTDFLIIEGADYVGGRVKNANFNGVTVGLGAQYTPLIEDSDINDKILHTWGIETHKLDGSEVWRNASSYQHPQDAIDSVWAKLDKSLNKVNAMALDIVANGKPDVSQRTALIKAGWKARTPLEKVAQWLSYDVLFAEPISVTSLLSSVFLHTDGIHYINDTRGYEAIFKFMAPDLYQNESIFNDHVRLNQRVKSIDYSNKDKVVVTCDDHRVYTGDYVLVTFNLGVFQNNLVQFIPELPDWKTNILSQFSSVAFTTIYLNFPDKFWDDVENIINVHERYNYYTRFFNFDYYHSGSIPGGTNILMVHILGEEAERIDGLSDEDVKEEIENVLQNLYGLDSPPQASDILIHSWLRDPLHMGAYTNRPVEVPSDFLPKLQSRVDRVFFGGEVTGGGRGNIGDAYESGMREAKKMLKCIAGQECPEFYHEHKKENLWVNVKI